MNFQQLKIIRESARCNYNLTEVANTLFTSQSGVSRHIRELEEELGIDLRRQALSGAVFVGSCSALKSTCKAGWRGGDSIARRHVFNYQN